MSKELFPIAEGPTNGQTQPTPREPRPPSGGANAGASDAGRLAAGLSFIAVLILIFWKPLAALSVHAYHSELHSYVLLVPFISAYLVYIQWRQLPRERCSSPGWAAAFLVAGLAALGAAWGLKGGGLSHNDELSLTTFSLVCLVLAGGFLFLGRKWMAAVAFPTGFLFFTVPLPDSVVVLLETASKLASADVAELYFRLSGTPTLRDGTFFQLPGILIEVQQECSGIRSSLILFITGLLASYLLLRTPWRRALLVGVVIPLGILRNGLRILTVSLLCVHVGPHMIHGFVHRRGGPYFFALSLIPLFFLLWWLRRGEVAAGRSIESVRRERE